MIVLLVRVAGNKMTKRTSVIALTFGYVESTSVAILLFSSPEPYVDRLTALQSLSIQLLRHYCDRFKPSIKCKEKLHDPNKYTFCSSCGMPLERINIVGSFNKWIISIPKYTLDDLGDESCYGEWSMVEGLRPVIERSKEVLEIGQRGDYYIIKALATLPSDVFPIRLFDDESEVILNGQTRQGYKDWTDQYIMPWRDSELFEKHLDNL